MRPRVHELMEAQGLTVLEVVERLLDVEIEERWKTLDARARILEGVTPHGWMILRAWIDRAIVPTLSVTLQGREKEVFSHPW